MHAVIRFRPLLVHLCAPVLLGMAAASLSGNNNAFYSALHLPHWALPHSMIHTIWTILYLLMGLSAYLVYSKQEISNSDRRCAMTFYGFALLANFLWSFLFFRFRLFTLAALWTIVVFVLLALCTMVFYRIRPWAGVLLAPTLAWLVFTGALNFSVAALNS